MAPARDSRMAAPEPGGTLRQRKMTGMARRVVELVTAAALLGAAFYFPTTNAGRVYLIALVVAVFLGLALLHKWPSR